MPLTAEQISSHDNLLRAPRLRALDAGELFGHASRFERFESDYRAGSSIRRRPIKLAILASLSAQHLAALLKLFLYAEGVAPEIQLGGFDAVRSGLLTGGSEVWAFEPDVVLLLPATEDISLWPRMYARQTEVDVWVEQQAALHLANWAEVGRKAPHCRIYQGTFVEPLERPLGNLEAVYPFSRTNSLRQLNAYLLAQRPGNVTLVDLDAVAAQVGRARWFNEAGYLLSKLPFSLRDMPTACAYLARIIATGHGNIKKCLVLDLDNTLWGGVVGDDGVAKLRLDPTEAVGEAFLRFQRYVLTLKERGVLLAVCSKNDPEIARSPFREHPDIVLGLDDFVAFEASWDDKVTNIRKIARDLNIGLDSVVFFDDNPAERSLVQQFEPDVWVIDVPQDPASYVRALDNSFAFEWPQLTSEDLSRVDNLTKDRLRQASAATFVDYDGYLQSLEMKAVIEPATPEGISRLAQLFGKTNQFNTRTRRYGEGELLSLLQLADTMVIDVRFSDKFSSYGIVAAAVIRLQDDTAFIENWVMSCRVFERGLEQATLEGLVRKLAARGVERILGEIIPTPKNGYVGGLYERLGFEKASAAGAFTTAQGGTLFALELPKWQHGSHHVNIGPAPLGSTRHGNKRTDA